MERFPLSIGQNLAYNLSMPHEVSKQFLNSSIEVLHESPLAICILDTELRYIWANQKWISDWALDPTNLIGRLHYEVFPTIPERWKKVHKDCLAGETIEADEDMFDHSGELIWLKWKVCPWRDEVGRIGGVVMYSQTITLQREKLKIAQDRYQSLVNSVPDAVFVIDSASGVITYVNKQAETLLERQVTGSTKLHFMDSIEIWQKNETAPVRIDDIGKLITLSKDQGNEIFFRRNSSWKLPIEVSINHTESSQGSFYTCLVRDVSLRKNIEKEIQRALDIERSARQLAEESNRSKDEFLATLSHELRTPLTTVIMWAQMLRANKVESSQVDHALFSIEQNAAIQVQLISDLLDVSRILTGKLNLLICEVDLSALLHQAIDDIKPLALRSGVSVELGTSFQGLFVKGDWLRVKQILWNLLTNAVKFSSEGSSVEVKVIELEKFVEIVVSDSGKGINEEFLPHIFRRFSQEDSTMTRRYGGLGLGLSIARDLANLQGGTISVQSPGEGKGSAFTVSLPKVLVPMARQRIEREIAQVAPKGDIQLRGKRILLVDDSEDTRFVIRLALETLGVEVFEADTASTAFEAFFRLKPDLIISDISMPEEDGYSLLYKIRKQESSGGSARVPAIALTAYVGSEDVLRAKNAGFDSHLAKPIAYEALRQKVSEVLGANDSSSERV